MTNDAVRFTIGDLNWRILSPGRLVQADTRVTTMTRGRGIAAALLLCVACGRGSGTARGCATDRVPPDAPRLWLHREGEGRSRILLVRADGAISGEWRSAESLDEKTRDEVKAALDAIAPPSHAVEINVRNEVLFKTLKSLMLAVGSPGSGGYIIHVHPMSEFPPRIVKPGTSGR